MKANSNQILEDFIRNNTTAIDDLIAPEGIWNRIEKELRGRKSNGLKRFIFFSLALLIATLCGIVLISKLKKPQAEAHPVLLDFASITDYEETQQYFTVSIEESTKKLVQLNPDATILNDLRLMDKSEKDLLQELVQAEGEYKMYIINALIANYQSRLNLIQQLIFEIEKNNKNYEIH